jgi:type IV secretion system protein VirB9
MKKLVLALLLGVAAINAHALDVPRPGQYDYRVKSVDYNPADVVKVVAHFGYQVDIVLQEGEFVVPKGVYMGDTDAWQFGTLANHMFVKPKEEGGQTNMTVITNRRTYSFYLSSHWSKKNAPGSNDMYFQVNFRYPADEAAKAAADAARVASAASAAAAKARLDAKLAEKPEGRNWNYWVQGSDAIAPDSAYDDGRFTFLTFRGNRDIPAIFLVNEDGSESLVNRHVEGDKVVIQSLSKKFVLRKGNSVACVFNESFDPIGTENKTGTTIPGVERVIKGDSQ